MPTPYARRLARIAEEQFDAYHLMDEGDQPLSAQIRRYWTEIGLTFPGVSTAWSAVFVSWCVKRAGATAGEFMFSQRHGDYVYTAIQRAEAGSGVFRGYHIDRYAPQVGDIIQNNRNGHAYTFDYARTHQRYESHTAIVTERGEDSGGGFVITVGGNESDSVRKKLIRLRPDGRIRQRTDSPYICVIQTLK